MDMGGTTCLVSLLENNSLAITTETEYAGYRLKMPSVDIKTIGAGGGSIAWIDQGGICVWDHKVQGLIRDQYAMDWGELIPL